MVGVAFLTTRATQLALTIITFSISAALETSLWPSVTSQVNFALVATILGLIAMIFIAVTLPLPSLAHPWIVFSVDLVITVLLFCAAIALSAEMGVHSCGNLDYLMNNAAILGSSHRCHLGQADCAFLWFTFAAWAGGCVISGLGLRGSSGRSPGSHPSMTRV